MASAAASVSSRGSRSLDRKASLAIPPDGEDPLPTGELLQLTAYCPANLDEGAAMRNLGVPAGDWLASLAEAGHTAQPQVRRVYTKHRSSNSRPKNVLEAWVPSQLVSAVSAKIEDGLVRLAGVPGGVAGAKWPDRPTPQLFRLINTPAGLPPRHVTTVLEAAGYTVLECVRPRHPSCPGLRDGTVMELSFPSNKPPPKQLTMALSGGLISMRLDIVDTALPPLQTQQQQRQQQQRAPSSARKQPTTAAPWAASAPAAAAPSAKRPQAAPRAAAPRPSAAAVAAAAAASAGEPEAAAEVFVRPIKKGTRQQNAQRQQSPPAEQQQQQQQEQPASADTFSAPPPSSNTNDSSLPSITEALAAAELAAEAAAVGSTAASQAAPVPAAAAPEQAAPPEQAVPELAAAEPAAETAAAAAAPAAPEAAAAVAAPATGNSLSTAEPSLGLAGQAVEADAAAPVVAAAAAAVAAAASEGEGEWRTRVAKRNSGHRSPPKGSPATARPRTLPPAAGDCPSPADADQASPMDAEGAAPGQATVIAASPSPFPISPNRYELRTRSDSAAAPANAAQA